MVEVLEQGWLGLEVEAELRGSSTSPYRQEHILVDMELRSIVVPVACSLFQVGGQGVGDHLGQQAIHQRHQHLLKRAEDSLSFGIFKSFVMKGTEASFGQILLSCCFVFVSFFL